MFQRRPSPALVISCISLVVALSGTAVAANHYLITNSSQIKNGVIKGSDLRKGTITKTQLSPSVLPAPADQTSAVEVHRQSGPALANDGGKAEVVSLDLAPGVYAIFGKTVLSPDLSQQDLLDILQNTNKTTQGDCTLDVGSTTDYAAGALTTPNSTNAQSLSMQLTRSLGTATKAVMTCESDGAWHAADSSIIAMKVGSTTRSETP